MLGAGSMCIIFGVAIAGAHVEQAGTLGRIYARGLDGHGDHLPPVCIGFEAPRYSLHFFAFYQSKLHVRPRHYVGHRRVEQQRVGGLLR